MAKNTREHAFFETISLYLRAAIMIAVVSAVAITAFCWEKMPDGIRNFASLMQNHGGSSSEMPPQNFRAKFVQIQDEMPVKLGQPQQFAPFPIIPVNYTEPTDSQSLKPSTVATTEMYTPVLENQEACEMLGEDLKQLGATSFRLESWGNAGQYFRFSCTVSLNPQLPHISRHFDAIAENGVDAMQNVKTQILDWKNAR